MITVEVFTPEPENPSLRERLFRRETRGMSPSLRIVFTKDDYLHLDDVRQFWGGDGDAVTVVYDKKNNHKLTINIPGFPAAEYERQMGRSHVTFPDARRINLVFIQVKLLAYGQGREIGGWDEAVAKLSPHR